MTMGAPLSTMPRIGEKVLSIVEFTPLGGVGEVGANCYILEAGGLRILLDCGFHPKKEGMECLPDFSYLDGPPDAIVVSHAHIDHCGALPYILKLHPGVPIFTTAPTAQIMDRMLHNSVSVMGILKKERGIEDYPLYEHQDVEAVKRQTVTVNVNEPFSVVEGSPVTLRFIPAGHVLGSVSIRIDAPECRLFYTGDICTTDQELVKRFVPPDDAETVDTLIIESTYGANEDADGFNYFDEAQRFASDMVEVLDRGGVVLVPSFALGRAQEILNIIARFQSTGVLPDVPVYASGLGRAIYEVYDRFSDFLKPNADLCPLSDFERVGDVWNPNVVRELIRKSCIIVATSGMMIENTPSAMIAQQLIKEERHAIFFVGYCDPETLGHKVKHAGVGDSFTFTLGGKPVENKLTDIGAYHFSAHAPRNALREVVGSFKPEHLILVHGDPPAVEWMRDHCGDGCSKYVPVVGETIRLRG